MPSHQVSQYTLVSGPDGPRNAEIRPDCGSALSGPLRPRTEAPESLQAGMAYQGEGMDWWKLSTL